MNYGYIINSIHCEGIPLFWPDQKLPFTFATLLQTNTCPHWKALVCRGRRYKVHVWAHFPSTLHGLDSEQAGKLRTNPRGNHRSATTSWRCSLTATLNCTPVHLQPVSEGIINICISSGTLTIGPLISSSISGRRPSSYHIGLVLP